MARILGNAGSPIVRNDISTIGYTVRDLTTGQTVASGSLTVASVVYNSLQQSDPRWEVDNEDTPGPDMRWGYNFAATLPASAFASLFTVEPADWQVPYEVRPHRVRITVEFTPVSGEKFRQLWDCTPLASW